MNSVSFITKLKNFILFDWKTNSGEIKYWKISFYISMLIIFFYNIFFNGYIVQVKDVYVKMNEYWNAQNITFIWVTDGAGWKSTLKPLREYFDKADYLLNLEMLKDEVLTKILL